MNLKSLLTVIVCLACATAVQSQTVIITDFPIAKGMSVNESFWVQFDRSLQRIADTLKADPDVMVVVYGQADAIRYDAQHDAKNAGTALSRGHSVRNRLIHGFGVDSTRIHEETGEVRTRGDSSRIAIATVVSRNATMADLQKLKDSLAAIPPQIEICSTYVYVTDTTDRVSALTKLARSIRLGLNVIINRDVANLTPSVGCNIRFDKDLSMFATYGAGILTNQDFKDERGQYINGHVDFQSVGATIWLLMLDPEPNDTLKNFGVTVALSQFNMNDDYSQMLVRRRCIEFGPTLTTRPWLEGSVLVGYGKNMIWDRRELVSNWSVRFALNVQVF
ncbi:MAG: hypothetical protein PHY34_01215 [Patescibacteria group bacterium]|nr:hypothetical protein [Patescibacteria group bacterium]MDD5715162.1 hypothetical protein [Patescibacteria group bacterium]